MTIKTQYLAELKDVLAIRLTCSKCDGFVGLPMAGRTHITELCPNCRQSWFLPDSTDLVVLEQLLRACVSLGDKNATAPCRIQLELNIQNIKESLEGRDS